MAIILPKKNFLLSSEELIQMEMLSSPTQSLQILLEAQSQDPQLLKSSEEHILLKEMQIET
jgi:hypothetical protein